jgi:hypothetical protein
MQVPLHTTLDDSCLVNQMALAAPGQCQFTTKTKVGPLAHPLRSQTRLMGSNKQGINWKLHP